MEKKNNKKLFAIIGGSVLAFILTIALSVSITLAYFGNASTKEATIKMDTKVEVGHATNAVQSIDAALPGQGITIDAKANVVCGTNGAYLVAIVATSEGAEAFLTNDGFKLDTASAAKWQSAGNNYFVYATGETELTKIATSTTSDTAPVFKGTFVVNPALTNTTGASADGALKSFEIEVTFVAVQGILFEDDGSVDQEVTLADVVALADAVIAQG